MVLPAADRCVYSYIGGSDKDSMRRWKSLRRMAEGGQGENVDEGL